MLPIQRDGLGGRQFGVALHHEFAQLGGGVRSEDTPDQPKAMPHHVLCRLFGRRIGPNDEIGGIESRHILPQTLALVVGVLIGQTVGPTPHGGRKYFRHIRIIDVKERGRRDETHKNEGQRHLDEK